MKRLLLVLMLFITVGCQQTEVITCFPIPGCHTTAIVRQTRVAGNCALVFELEDGTFLVPERRQYLQPPTPEEDPIYHFEMVPGTRVTLGARGTNESCSLGRIYFITCIEVIQQPAL